MGEVYRAHDTRLDREVAIKVLPESLTSDPDRLRRFEEEARATAALNHPNILAVYQMATHENLSYMVSELLDGETLRERLSRGPIPLRKAMNYAIQIAHGLAAAHDRGIVHRDLKPENLFVTKDSRVKILDFGLAKQLAVTAMAGSAATVSHSSESGIVLGTVGYMSPEQVRGNVAYQRSDIFSVGVVLYEMISGKRAFSGDSSIEAMNAILRDDPPELGAPEKSLPPALDRIVRRCLEKNPEERFQSARDISYALDAISAPLTASGTALALPAHKRNTLWLAVAGVAMLAVSAGWSLGVATHRLADYKLLTFDSGYAGPARFSRDGNTVIYSAAWNPTPARSSLPGSPAA